jgi:hypothetical protein
VTDPIAATFSRALAKGHGVSRVIKVANIEGEQFHLVQYIGTQKPAFKPVTGFCVSLASKKTDIPHTQKESHAAIQVSLLRNI